MSRLDIRKKTDVFINTMAKQGHSTYKSDVSHADADHLFKGATTSAGEAFLPMTITIGDRDGLPLSFTMLINPENTNHGMTFTTSTALARQGYISQLWGSNQDTFSATGKSAAFMAMPPKKYKDGEEADLGLTNQHKSKTFGFLNLMALVDTYKNNGVRFLDPSDIQKKYTRVIHLIRGVEISYDSQIFMGHFSNFTLDEDAATPFLFSYNFEFIISTLSKNYNEVRGHFTPLSAEGVPPPRTLDDLQKTKKKAPEKPPVTKKPLDALSFNAAFAKEYKEKGKGGTMTWQGKSYALIKKTDLISPAPTAVASRGVGQPSRVERVT